MRSLNNWSELKKNAERRRLFLEIQLFVWCKTQYNESQGNQILFLPLFNCMHTWVKTKRKKHLHRICVKQQRRQTYAWTNIYSGQISNNMVASCLFHLKNQKIKIWQRIMITLKEQKWTKKILTRTLTYTNACEA